MTAGVYGFFIRPADLPHIAFTRTTPSDAGVQSPRIPEAGDMLDLVLILLGLGFFAVMAGYVAGCDRV